MLTNGNWDKCPSCGWRMLPRKQTQYNYYCGGCDSRWMIAEGKEPVYIHAHLVSLDKKVKVKAHTKQKRNLITKKVGNKYMLFDKDLGEFLIGFTFNTSEEADKLAELM